MSNFRSCRWVSSLYPLLGPHRHERTFYLRCYIKLLLPCGGITKRVVAGDSLKWKGSTEEYKEVKAEGSRGEQDLLDMLYLKLFGVKTLVSILIEPSLGTVVLLDSCLVWRKELTFMTFMLEDIVTIEYLCWVVFRRCIWLSLAAESRPFVILQSCM